MGSGEPPSYVTSSHHLERDLSILVQISLFVNRTFDRRLLEYWIHVIRIRTLSVKVKKVVEPTTTEEGITQNFVRLFGVFRLLL